MKSMSTVVGWALTAIILAASVTAAFVSAQPSAGNQSDLDRQLAATLKAAGFSGAVDQSLERRLGRKLDPKKVELGRLIFFDRISGLHTDNSCAGCHSPTRAFGDTQSIAIGVDNNNRVGPGRTGPRNQRRTPSVINNALYPALMWNGRFSANSANPFDNSKGFSFPLPEGRIRFFPHDPEVKHLLVAQAHIPFTELPEMAGFHGIVQQGSFTSSRFNSKLTPTGTINEFFPREPRILQLPRNSTERLDDGDRPVTDPDYYPFHDEHGSVIPRPEPDGSRNEPIRQMVIERFQKLPGYRRRFAGIFRSVARGGRITFAMVGQALAEFQFSLTFADAPIDRFARGQRHAMTASQKRGALLFFGKANCVACHSVAGKSNEMFSDFAMHNIGVPQIAPVFGKDTGNVPFRNKDGVQTIKGRYDIGLAEVTETKSEPRPEDRYKFRTSPLRTVALQSSFFHNGCFTRLEDAIRHHLDPARSGRSYDPVKAGVAKDLRNVADPEPVLAQLDPLVATPIKLSDPEFRDLVGFVRGALLDPGARPEMLRKEIPKRVPSGLPLPVFE